MDFPLVPKSTEFESLKVIPEEVLWISNFTSDDSIETYRQATTQFFELIGIRSPEEIRQVTHAHILHFRKVLQDEGKSPRTINNRLSALSSLFNNLIEHQVVKINPVQSIKRMKINSDRVEAKALSPGEVRNMLNAPELSTLKGKRDRVILGILFFAGPRVNEVAKLKVKDYFEEQGFTILDFEIKGGKRNKLAIHPELKNLIDDYLLEAGHGHDKNAPLFLPAKPNRNWKKTRHLSKRQLERIWSKYAEYCGILGTSPHSARATFITQALENNCPIEDVQKSVGHSLIKTTQMYDKRAAKYRQSASFSVRY